jgi:APA family basic amino acid/polyamine antiporter
MSAVGGAAAICLFSYLGVEAAAVAAAKVRDPRRNVPRATVVGTLLSTVAYVLSLVAVFGIMPAAALAQDENKASFASVATEVSGTAWAGDLVALMVVVSGIGAMNGWTMLCAEMPLAAARDGLFPRWFAAESRRGMPWVGIVTSSALASVAVLLSYTGTHGATVFTTLVLMTGIAAAVPYAFSALAQIVWRVQDGHATSTWRLVWDLTAAGVALVLSLAFIYYSRNAGQTWYVVWGPYLMTAGAAALGLPVYLAQRGKMSAPPPLPSSSDRPPARAERGPRRPGAR